MHTLILAYQRALLLCSVFFLEWLHLNISSANSHAAKNLNASDCFILKTKIPNYQRFYSLAQF